MPSFRYRALKPNGEMVAGVLTATNIAEVFSRIDSLRLVPVDAFQEERASLRKKLRWNVSARAEDVTIFTSDLALLLSAGARLNEALELLAADGDVGRLRNSLTAVKLAVVSGESLADALAQQPELFPPIYIALVRVGEATGALPQMLQVLARERARSEVLRRKLADALRYPLFLLFAAAAVLLFFLVFVLPQFSAVLRDFGAELDPGAKLFVRMSDYIVANGETCGIVAATILATGLLAWRQTSLRTALLSVVKRLPVIRAVFAFYGTALFCRNLDVLVAAGVPLTSALRILAEIMESVGLKSAWMAVLDKVRHGGKLSDAIAESSTLPAMAVRMLRLGEETGQLATLAGRVAEFYESKLQRSIERAVGLVGPVAIITISVIIGGLIVSVMTSLLSVSELVG